MTITVDPSIIVAILLNEPSRQALLELTSGAELNSAQSLPWEVGNALSALCRMGRISAEQSGLAIKRYRAIPVRLAEIDLANAVDLAVSNRIYAYDAFILECARKYRSPLLTLDRKQREIALTVGIQTIEIPS